MKAFEVYLNGKHLVTAGIRHNNGILYSLTEMHFGGMLSYMLWGNDLTTKERVEWALPDVKAGDEITVKIVETDRISPEHRRWQWDTSERKS